MIKKEPTLRLDVLGDYRNACYGFCAVCIWVTSLKSVRVLALQHGCA